jgi:hypothetical protein
MVSSQERVFDMLPKLVQQVRDADELYDAQLELSSEDVKKWYFQHILVKAIQQFSLKQDLVLPKHLLRYLSCFENDSGMDKIYRRLIGLNDPDKMVLGKGMTELKQVMDTQALDVTITDEITQWRISLND